MTTTVSGPAAKKAAHQAGAATAEGQTRNHYLRQRRRRYQDECSQAKPMAWLVRVIPQRTSRMERSSLTLLPVAPQPYSLERGRIAEQVLSKFASLSNKLLRRELESQLFCPLTLDFTVTLTLIWVSHRRFGHTNSCRRVTRVRSTDYGVGV